MSIYESQPRRQFNTRSLLLGRLNKATSGFSVPDMLSFGVPIEGILLAMTESDLQDDADEYENETTDDTDLPDIPVHEVLPAVAGAAAAPDVLQQFPDTFE